ncbi:MAG: hypothetical protein GC190_02795 [Alphaproteobacteria bacterium]|nr:hypothetical protein [Alphaproteobacteria bacterium]
MTQRGNTGGAFSTRIIIALLIVGVFSFSSFITLSTFAPDIRRGDNGEAHALSRSAIGFAGAVELMRSLGTDVSVSRKPGGNEQADLVVLTPGAELTREQLNRLGGLTTLVVLSKWATYPVREHPGWVARASTMANSRVVEPISAFAPNVKISRAAKPSRINLRVGGTFYTAGEIDELQTLSGDGLDPIVTAPGGGIILARVAKQTAVYVLADPDFLNTQGVANFNTARAGMAIVDLLRDDGAVVFDVTLNGLETGRSLLRVALTPPLLGATLALLAAGALLAWRAAMLSGPRARQERAIALGKKALAENSAALIHIAGREYTMGGRYAALLAAAAAEKIGAARTESAETFAMLDRVGAMQGMSTSYSALAAQAANAHTAAEVVAASRQLNAWIEEMLRAAR